MASTEHELRNWPRALSLGERLARTATLSAASCQDQRAAQRHLDHWRRQEPRDDWSFERRWARRGVSADQLTRTLGALAADGDDQPPPGWAERAVAALRAARDDRPIPSERPVAHSPVDFLTLLEPIVDDARREVRAELEHMLAGRRPWFGDSAALEQALAANLYPRLLSLIGRTLVLELHAARLLGELPGDTPQERFAAFIGNLRKSDVAARILNEYPVLTRLIVQSIDQWRAYSVEVAAHLAADASRLQTTLLKGEDPGPVTAIDGGVGDRHRDGRSVLAVQFASGRRVVYKPKSMAVENNFAELLEWLNDRGAEPRFRPLAVLDGGDHGWAEFIAAAPCASAGEVADYYRRQGGYLAVLYLLGATDLHCENLIAAGCHPMLIDLEALFHQGLPGPRKDPASQGLSASVMAVRMLPQQVYVEGVTEAIDFSALGASDGQPAPYLAPVWRDVGADSMHFGLERGVLPPSRHRPTLDGAAVEVADYEPAIIEGFCTIYDLLRRHRAGLLDDRGPLAAFAADQVRFIARPSQTYAILLDQSLHPERLCDALERDRLFDRLWLRVREFPALGRLVDAEIADLARHDIPRFTARPGSRDLWTDGGERIDGFFPETALEAVRRRVRRLSAADRARQVWLIQAAFAIMPRRSMPSTASAASPDCVSGQATSLVTFGDGPSGPRGETATSDGSIAGASERLASARRLGDRLIELAYLDDDAVGWNSLIPRQRGWSIGPIGVDVEAGLAGNAWFLGELAAQTGERRYAIFAQKVVATIMRRLDERAPRGEPPATLLDGTLRRLATIWNDKSLHGYVDALEKAAATATGSSTVELSTPAGYPRNLDIPSGLAGLAGEGLRLLGR